MNLYFISGLAADERMFKRLHFPLHISPVFLPWLKPLSADESLEIYVQRMAERIDTTKPFVLMGLSFGGIVCCELNRILYPQKTILISSVCNSDCFPPRLRWIKKLHLEQKFRPQQIKATPAFINNYLFGATSPQGKKLLADTIKCADDDLLCWSLKQIVNWQFCFSVPNLIQIHGNKDNIFPLRYVQAEHVIENGSHLAIYEQADEVSKILQQVL